MDAGRRALLTTALGALLLAFAAAHSAEDFAYGVPRERFGIDTTLAAYLLGAGFAVHLVVGALTARDRALGYAGATVLGLGWLLAAALDHLGEVLTADDYRAGVASKALEVGLMLAGAALAVAGGWALRDRLGEPRGAGDG